MLPLRGYLLPGKPHFKTACPPVQARRRRIRPLPFDAHHRERGTFACP